MQKLYLFLLILPLSSCRSTPDTSVEALAVDHAKTEQQRAVEWREHKRMWESARDTFTRAGNKR